MECYGLQLVTPASGRPVSVDEARSWLRLSHQADDAEVGALIDAAVELVRQEYGRQLLTATWRMSLERFPCWDFRLPVGPARAVTSIQYVDTNGETQTLDSARYVVDTTADPAVVQPVWAGYWPVTRCQRQAVLVTFTAGYGTAADVPESVKTAIKLAVAWWYERRGDERETAGTELPKAAERLLALNWNGVVA